MSHITRFSISGLAGRSQVYEQKLDRHVNVFFGLNGSGKTSLLKILDSAMQGDGSILGNVPFEAAEVHIYSEDYEKEYTRTIDRKSVKQMLQDPVQTALFVDDSYEEHRRRISARPSAVPWVTDPQPPANFSGRWRHTFLSISRMYSPSRFTTAAQRSALLSGGDAGVDEFLNESFAETLKQVWSTYYTSVLRNVQIAQSQGLANILKAVLTTRRQTDSSDSLNPDIAYKNLESFLKRQGSPQILPDEKTFKRRYMADPDLRSVVSDIDEVENRIASAIAPRVRLQELIGRMFSGRKSVSFGENEIEVTIGNQERISVGLLSSGEKQVLRLLVEMLRVGESTFLVDEPELSMHIDWQRELIASMRSLNDRAQLIFATHSPEIMADVEDERIYRL